MTPPIQSECLKPSPKEQSKAVRLTKKGSKREHLKVGHPFKAIMIIKFLIKQIDYFGRTFWNEQNRFDNMHFGREECAAPNSICCDA